MWLLRVDGAFDPATLPADAVEVAGEDPVDGVPDAGAVVVVFGGTADGRGFSVGRQLRSRGYDGILLAAGPLIPDQARHAFQSGFDGILIDEARLNRHGADAWRDALGHAVPELYVADGTSRASERGIWALRHVVLANYPSSLDHACGASHPPQERTPAFYEGGRSLLRLVLRRMSGPARLSSNVFVPKMGSNVLKKLVYILV